MHIPKPNELKEWRERLGITQAKASDAVGITQSYLARIESGHSNPSYNLILKLADFYNSVEGAKEETIKDKYHKGIDYVDATDTLEKVASLMKWKGYSQVPVFRNGHSVGSINEMQVNAQIHELGRETAMRVVVSDVMSAPYPELDEDSPLSLAASMLKHVPLILVKRGQNLVGVLTRSDLL